MRCQLPGASGFGPSILPGCLCLSLSTPAAAPGGPAAATTAAAPGGAGAAGAPGTAAAFVGLEGGQLLRCHLAEASEAALREFGRGLAAGERLELRSPVREAGYERHEGSVTGVAASRFQVRSTHAVARGGCLVPAWQYDWLL